MDNTGQIVSQFLIGAGFRIINHDDLCTMTLVKVSKPIKTKADDPYKLHKFYQPCDFQLLVTAYST